jgi:hypothetical protein
MTNQRGVTLLVIAGAAAFPAADADLTPDGHPAAPVIAERRYRLSAAIRPLLFWVGAKNVDFKLIRARVEGDGARAESTTVFAPEDFTFRQLDELRRFVETARPTPRVRAGQLPPTTRPGLLFALADLVGAGVEAARAPGSAGPLPRKLQYT